MSMFFIDSVGDVISGLSMSMVNKMIHRNSTNTLLLTAAILLVWCLLVSAYSFKLSLLSITIKAVISNVYYNTYKTMSSSRNIEKERDELIWKSLSPFSCTPYFYSYLYLNCVSLHRKIHKRLILFLIIKSKPIFMSWPLWFLFKS